MSDHAFAFVEITSDVSEKRLRLLSAGVKFIESLNDAQLMGFLVQMISCKKCPIKKSCDSVYNSDEEQWSCTKMWTMFANGEIEVDRC